MRASPTILLAMLFVVGAASAQTAETLPRGTRIRITPASPAQVVVGRLIAVTDSTLVVRHDRGDFTFPRSVIRRLEVSRGTSRGRSAGRGALGGLVVGGVVGFAWAEVIDCTGFWCFEGGPAAALGATTGLAVGTILGLVVGSFERWRDTDVPARLSILPTRHGSLAIASRIPF
ncbi:MAG TPA: hypothetical protein VJ650_09430 [Gemmatimonadaceae bacterium]|nr:hypothetical protein [Gemmatimonadaceae bacterium]